MLGKHKTILPNFDVLLTVHLTLLECDAVQSDKNSSMLRCNRCGKPLNVTKICEEFIRINIIIYTSLALYTLLTLYVSAPLCTDILLNKHMLQAFSQRYSTSDRSVGLGVVSGFTFNLTLCATSISSSPTRDRQALNYVQLHQATWLLSYVVAFLISFCFSQSEPLYAQRTLMISTNIFRRSPMRHHRCTIWTQSLHTGVYMYSICNLCSCCYVFH